MYRYFVHNFRYVYELYIQIQSLFCINAYFSSIWYNLAKFLLDHAFNKFSVIPVLKCLKFQYYKNSKLSLLFKNKKQR